MVSKSLSSSLAVCTKYIGKDLHREEEYKRVWFQKVIDSWSVDYFNSIIAPSENRIAGIK